jgi:hypothetical protein
MEAKMASKTVFIVAHWSSYSKEFQYSIQGYAPGTDNGYILLEEREIHFDTPNDATLRLRVSEALKQKKIKVMADAYVEGKEIDEVIQEMLALEDKSDKAPQESDNDLPF